VKDKSARCSMFELCSIKLSILSELPVSLHYVDSVIRHL
jgi:hypothetical protein